MTSSLGPGFGGGGGLRLYGIELGFRVSKTARQEKAAQHRTVEITGRCPQLPLYHDPEPQQRPEQQRPSEKARPKVLTLTTLLTHLEPPINPRLLVSLCKLDVQS